MQRHEYTTHPNYLQWIMTVLLLALVFGLFTLDTPEIPEIPTAAAIAAQIEIPSLPIPADLDLTQINQILNEVNEDDDWELEVELLAMDEWEDNGNRDIFRAIEEIEGNIHDEDDIEYIREDESSRFRRMDADDRDGVVTHFLKVKYEDDEGDDHKVYLTVRTVVDDGEVDDQEIWRTED